MVTILITGKNGQLGFELQRALSPLAKIVALDRVACNLIEKDTILRLIRQIRPTIIINAAAYTAVDKAEYDRQTAFAVNAIAPRIIGEEAERLGALVVHYSTDYVFDGTKINAYDEIDIPNPLSVYGKSKLAGEQALLASCACSVILRTSWVIGVHGKNFAKTILRLATEQENLSVVADQFGAPTSSALLADVTAHIVRQYLKNGKTGFPFGLYHTAASGETSWYNYAHFVITAALAAGKNLKTTSENLVPIITSEYPTLAQRPTNSRLNSELFQKTFDLRLPPWQENLNYVLQQIL